LISVVLFGFRGFLSSCMDIPSRTDAGPIMLANEICQFFKQRWENVSAAYVVVSAITDIAVGMLTNESMINGSRIITLRTSH
jgi:hypothetical protein